MVSKKFEITETRGAGRGLELPEPVERAVVARGGFDVVVGRLPPPRDLASRAKLHVALSDATRLRILHALGECTLCPCLLKRITRVSDSKLSYHLKVLEGAGLIEARRTRSWRVYSITKKGRRAISR